MNTRLMMSTSALFLGALGLTATFMPQELLGSIGIEASPFPVLMVQLLGAAWAGFAILNWMARGNLIGGVYSKPVAMGNMAYFLIAGIALAKVALKAPSIGLVEIALVGLHLLFAGLFAYTAFTHPNLQKREKARA
ncbi:MAG: hypothetical protein WBB45_12505 [Cyclobacteriaceae bacterium]